MYVLYSLEDGGPSFGRCRGRKRHFDHFGGRRITAENAKVAKGIFVGEKKSLGEFFIHFFSFHVGEDAKRQAVGRFFAVRPQGGGEKT